MTIRTALQLLPLAMSTFHFVVTLPAPSQAAVSLNNTGAITRSISDTGQEMDVSLTSFSSSETRLANIKSSGETIKLDEPSSSPAGLFTVLASMTIVFALKKTKRPAEV